MPSGVAAKSKISQTHPDTHCCSTARAGAGVGGWLGLHGAGDRDGAASAGESGRAGDGTGDKDGGGLPPSLTQHHLEGGAKAFLPSDIITTWP